MTQIETTRQVLTRLTLLEARPTSSGGGVADGNKGSITVTSGGSTWTINTGAVTNDMLAGSITLGKLTGLGAGVSTALAVASDTSGGFLTAAAGGTLPVSRGGTGGATPAAANANLGRVTVRKTADEILTNALLGSRTLSTDFAADSQLVIPLEANTLYRVEWGLLATSPNIELMKVRFTYPTRDVNDVAGGAISCGQWGNGSPSNHNGGATILALSNHVGANQVRGNVGMMTLNIGATPGNLRVEWGKVAAGTGNTTMLKNSYLIATKIN